MDVDSSDENEDCLSVNVFTPKVKFCEFVVTKYVVTKIVTRIPTLFLKNCLYCSTFMVVVSFGDLGKLKAPQGVMDLNSSWIPVKLLWFLLITD